MKNIKISYFIVLLFFNSILISFLAIYCNNNNSKEYYANLHKDDEYNHSSNLITLSQQESENAMLQMISISDPTGVLIEDSNDRYNTYPGANITVKFYLIKLNYNGSKILDKDNNATYLIKYNRTTGSTENETLTSHIKFDTRINTYSGIIRTSVLPEGTHNITINIDLLNYTFELYNFTLSVKRYLALQIISISALNEIIEKDLYGRYNIYPECNITVEFILIDMYYNISEVLDYNNQATYLIKYFNAFNTRLNGTLSSYIKFDNITETYSGIIETSILSEETYIIKINIDLLNVNLKTNSFRLRVRKYILLEMISISDPGGEIKKLQFYNMYNNTYIGSNITVKFNLIYMDIISSYIYDRDNTATYLITCNREIVSNDISFKDEYEGNIGTSVLSEEGTYQITIYIEFLNLSFEPFTFTLVIIKKIIEPSISISIPNEIFAGEKFTVRISAQNNDTLEMADEVLIKIAVYINNGVHYGNFTRETNDLGYTSFTIITPLETYKISLKVEVLDNYKYESGYSLQISDIRITSFLILNLYIGIIIFYIVISIILYYRLIVPNKREKIKIRNKYKQICSDISKIDHIIINFKRNGKPIFHKSYIPKKINQERINKYLSSLSISKKSMNSQILLSEIIYEGKIILLANGKHIRASIILNKESSKILKNKLKEFICSFENSYENELKNVEVNIRDLISYKKIEKNLEDKLYIFIIFPHKIEYDFLDKTSLLNSDSKDLLNMTHNILKESGENFFYSSTLLKEFLKRPFKGIAQFFINFLELRKNQVFTTVNENS